MKTESKENRNNESKLTKHDIAVLGIRLPLLQVSFLYERVRAGGWAWAQTPVWKEIFGGNKKASSQTVANSLELINTSPPLVSILMELLTSLEEKHVDHETIKRLKNGLSSPMTGVGDAIYWFTLVPIVGGIAALFTIEGNVLEPIIFFLVYLSMFLRRIPSTHLGYGLGAKATNVIQDNSETITHVTTAMGLTIIGALISSYASLSLKVEIGAVSLQKDFLDKVFPNIFPLAFTFFLYWLFKKKQVLPVVPAVIVFVSCIVCSFFGTV